MDISENDYVLVLFIFKKIYILEKIRNVDINIIKNIYKIENVYVMNLNKNMLKIMKRFREIFNYNIVSYLKISL